MDGDVNVLKLASPLVLVVKKHPANEGDVRDVGSVPGSGRSPGEGNGNPLQYSCLDKSHGKKSLEGSTVQHKMKLQFTLGHTTCFYALMFYIQPTEYVLLLVLYQPEA